mmetsp:Transcript_3227/g.4884  ORF Transcript_3227/g.4884 Transcript_3227/m.4884 type:complete len:143 (+) Transcript_3227:45-473(+)|eukprot:CAMPEP_0197238050 /NCGR_PEP_ID=MMETSP1429-20130617/4676_1 /TAXON_ID=49237 /ORGANISM="Chaetoceros  sp., Strain UNC1202" /LENGTH=142 /DNA_ID=CAMNT_0042697145 /DNA_START=9 /DNA_END=437 /DNA_ORIENTATION=+
MRACIPFPRLSIPLLLHYGAKVTSAAVQSTTARQMEGTGTSADLDRMLNKIEADILKFKNKYEALLLAENKCSDETREACSKGNYDGCDSEFPSADCVGGQFAIDVCGTGKEGGCGGLMDSTSSRITLSPAITESAYLGEGG